MTGKFEWAKCKQNKDGSWTIPAEQSGLIKNMQTAILSKDNAIKQIETACRDYQEALEAAKSAYAEGDRESQMRGWAIDRATEYMKANTGWKDSFGDIFAVADAFLAYTRKPQQDAELKVETLTRGVA